MPDDMICEPIHPAQDHLALRQDVNKHMKKSSPPNSLLQSKFPRLTRKPPSTPLHAFYSIKDVASHHLPNRERSASVVKDSEGFRGDLSFGDFCDIFQPSALSGANPIDDVVSVPSLFHVENVSQKGLGHWHRRHHTFPSSQKNKPLRLDFEHETDASRTEHFRLVQSAGVNLGVNFDDAFRVSQSRRNLFSLTNVEIHSTLDPFIQLPMDITEQERSVLHFYLNYGRVCIWGTSKRPKHCPALDIARFCMQTCPIFVSTNIIVAETVLNRMTGRGPQPRYFMRRAQIYKAVNSLLSDESTPMHRKIYAIMDLAIIEYSNGKIELQNMHMTALDDLISVNGGLAACLSHLEDIKTLYVSARFYSNQFIRAEVQISTLQQLEAVLQRYLQNLRRIQAWSSVLQVQHSYAESVHTYRTQLNYLSDYFSHLIELWLSENEKPQPSFQNTSGAHFCAFSLAMTLVELNQPPTASFEFLYRVQTNMLESAEVSRQFGSELTKLRAFAAAHIIAMTRCEILADEGVGSEIRIAQAMVDAQKIFVRLSTARRIEIVTHLIEQVFGNPGREGAQVEGEISFDDTWSAALQAELLGSWNV